VRVLGQVVRGFSLAVIEQIFRLRERRRSLKSMDTSDTTEVRPKSRRQSVQSERTFGGVGRKARGRGNNNSEKGKDTNFKGESHARRRTAQEGRPCRYRWYSEARRETDQYTKEKGSLFEQFSLDGERKSSQVTRPNNKGRHGGASAGEEECTL